MDISVVNSRLKAEYIEYLQLLKGPAKSGLVNYAEHSLPLLMKASDEYLKSPVKILFVGKETYGWNDKMDKIEKYTIDQIIDMYRFEKMPWNSPFWRFIKRVSDRFNVACGGNQKQYGFMWTNISKMDLSKKSPKILTDNHSFYGIELLKKEIEILNPQIVIFLTSYRYDWLIELALPGVKQTYEKVIPLYLAKARFENKAIYRGYHPRFLVSRRSINSIDDVIDALFDDVSKRTKKVP